MSTRIYFLFKVCYWESCSDWVSLILKTEWSHSPTIPINDHLITYHPLYFFLKYVFLRSNNTADPSYTKNCPASGDKVWQFDPNDFQVFFYQKYVFLSGNNTADPSYTKSDNVILIIFRSLPFVISALTFSNYLRKNQMLYQFSHRSANLYICLYVFLSFSLSVSTQVSHSLHLSLCLYVFMSFYLSLCPFPHSSVNLYICPSISLFSSLSVSTLVIQSLHLSFYLSILVFFRGFPHRLVNPYSWLLPPCLSIFTQINLSQLKS